MKTLTLTITEDHLDRALQARADRWAWPGPFATIPSELEAHHSCLVAQALRDATGDRVSVSCVGAVTDTTVYRLPESVQTLIVLFDDAGLECEFLLDDIRAQLPLTVELANALQQEVPA
jgi:hypothetical protein